jgi:cytochrome c-type biogenesis protein CcmH/NrfG
MTSPSQAPFRQWTRKQAAILAVACLVVGIAGGWSIPGFHSKTAPTSASSSNIPAPPVSKASAAAQPDPAQLKAAADAQAAPLMDRLKSDPENPELLAELGNLYYDAQLYSTAVDFYRRALKAKPADAAVRTDMATAYWYMGNADLAIAEFNKALTFAPHNPNTLFNLGLVKWKAKKDAAGALADWEELLANNPAYNQKDEVEQMIAEVKKQQAAASGTKTTQQARNQ